MSLHRAAARLTGSAQRARVVATLMTLGAFASTAGCERRSHVHTVQATWLTNAAAHRGQIDHRVRYVCPPHGTPGVVSGTEVYTDDSSVCTAAVHASRLTFDEGGSVTIEVRGGQAQYYASTRNGVASQAAAQGSGSFVFVAPPPMASPPVTSGPVGGGGTSSPVGVNPPGGTVPPTGVNPPVGVSVPGPSAPPPVAGAPPGTTPIDWATNAVAYRGQVGTSITFYCPPGGTLGSVWGMSIYTDDSSICTAGVHMGRFTAETGGTVPVMITMGMPLYFGMPRNGVAAGSYGQAPGSFVIQQ